MSTSSSPIVQLGPNSATSEQPQPNSLTQGHSFKYYRPLNAAIPAPSLPDSFYSPTANDLKSAQATLEARTRNLADSPLELRAVREAREQAKGDRWLTATIRIRFSDRSQLEKTFPSTDKIKSVYAFVRGCLREDVQPVKFILYQSPPKRDLKVSDSAVKYLSLSELRLAPHSVLLLRFENDALNASNSAAPVTHAIREAALDLDPPPDPLVIVSPPNGVAGSTISLPSDSKEKKILPKWLRLGGRK